MFESDEGRAGRARKGLFANTAREPRIFLRVN
jgi:hypothetical protein